MLVQCSRAASSHPRSHPEGTAGAGSDPAFHLAQPPFSWKPSTHPAGHAAFGPGVPGQEPVNFCEVANGTPITVKFNRFLQVPSVKG